MNEPRQQETTSDCGLPNLKSSNLVWAIGFIADFEFGAGRTRSAVFCNRRNCASVAQQWLSGHDPFQGAILDAAANQKAEWEIKVAGQ